MTELKCAPELLSEAGFEVTVVYRGKTANDTLKTSVVYTRLNGDGKVYTPETGLYFLACGINEIPTDDVVPFVFRPYVITKNTTKLFGTETSLNAFDFKIIDGLVVSNQNECNYVSWLMLVGEN